MQDHGKEKFCLFCQLHFWNVSLEVWLSEQEEELTRQNGWNKQTRSERFGVKVGVLGERLLTWEST